MTFEELIIKRRSVRKYYDESVPTELLKDLIETSTYAPSAGNVQPWKFIIVNDKELLKEISTECKANMLIKITNNPEDFANIYRHMFENPQFNIFYNAPALIIILGDKSVKNFVLDCTLAASYLMFAAASNGLGTCWINFALAMSGSTKKRLGILDDYEIVAPLIVGYPEVIPTAPHRKNVEILNVVEKSSTQLNVV